MYSPTPPIEPIEAIEQQPQRQDSLDDQLRDLWRAAIKLGCYDAADWLRALLIYEGFGAWSCAHS